MAVGALHVSQVFPSAHHFVITIFSGGHNRAYYLAAA
jgi:hypothetical protein